MTRPITDALAEYVAKQEKKPKRDLQAVTFLTVKPDVVLALEAGYPLTTVYAYLKNEGRITSTYETFRRHVQRHIREQSEKVVTQIAPTEKPASPPKPPAANPGQSKSKIGGFSFNPTANPKDLY